MYNYFIFNGINSKDYGVHISGNNTFNAPVRDFEEVIVPGLDGRLTLDNGRYDAIEVLYDAFIVRDFDNNIRDFRNQMMSVRGYARLTDTYHPDEFYLARYESGLEADVTQLLHAGSFELVFTRDPRRYLLTGEVVQEFTGSGTITNPSIYSTKPLIRAYGTGTFVVNGTTITITYAANAYTDIDCQLMTAYYEDQNCNLYTELSGEPTLDPGENAITMSEGITKLEITPKWYRL